MKTIPILLASLSLVMLAASASAQSSAFNYQGHLMDGGSSANGSYDLQFTLKNALTGGSTVGTPQVVAPVSVVNGIFTVALDFGGAAFDGGDRFVETGVRPFGSAGPYTVLAPRQKLTSAPYAVRAANAGNAASAANLTGTLTAGNVPANLITGAMLANNTITATQIQNGAVGSAQLANNAVGAAQIASGAVTLSKIAATSASGYLGQGALSGLTTGTATATVTFAQPFSIAPPVVIQQPGWTLGAVSTTGFSATTPFAPVTVDSAGDVGADTSLAVVNGRPAISYRDATNFDLKYAIAPSADGTGTWTTVTVDSAGVLGAYTSLAVVNGRPAISYFDNSDFQGRLKYAIASTADGTGSPWTTLTVDTAGYVGEYTSLAVVDGRPAISYFDATNDDLKYAIAPSADGTGTWTTLTVDSAGSVGHTLRWWWSMAGPPSATGFHQRRPEIRHRTQRRRHRRCLDHPHRGQRGGVGLYTSLADRPPSPLLISTAT
ncbi:MAG: hypothetical protein HS117_06475 [Verrucomicrobiaceae bacterium]|nr:hypothetical protein [Verrucomicrobiaceae bacterium]